MSSVLGEDDAEAGASRRPAGTRRASESARARDRPTPADEEDSLEWEVPGEGRGAAEAEEPAEEDVLEETPEFLRDTPEQDRLWFEQRPPRDFDFDK